jgi:crotonobetainyl-CoA:carnitine CoA-transferase CaiB-like acyl-CoA transferase
MNDTNLPLSGVRVLELTHAVMGPTVGLVLADLGAEVIHVEPPEGDATRYLKGMGTGYFPFYGRNKKSLAVDLKSEQGKRILERLVPTADVFVENFAPGAVERLGLGYEALNALNPRLIYLSLKGFLDGPYEKRTALDEVAQMMGGLAYMTGPVGMPLRAGTSIIDIGGGMFGVIGILLALYERQRTGLGKLVRASLFETTAFFMGQHMAYSAISKLPVPPMPARVSAWAIYRPFPTKDGEMVFVGVTSDKHWVRFCQEFEQQEWLADKAFATNNGRIDERERLLPAIEAMLVQHTKPEIIARCERAGIPFAPIAKTEDLFDDPQLNHGKLKLLDTTLNGEVKTKLPRLPLDYAGADLGIRNDPPTVGEQTEELLTSLGYSAKEISALRAEKRIA